MSSLRQMTSTMCRMGWGRSLLQEPLFRSLSTSKASGEQRWLRGVGEMI